MYYDLINETFNKKEQISLLKRLLRIKSENPGNFESEIALEIKNILDQEGINSKLEYVDQNRANIYAILEGETEGKSLLYNGHLDTVPAGSNWNYPPFDAHEDNKGYIYGRGASDMKAGVSAMLYAAICMKRLGYPKKGRLILFFNADEEHSNLGMKQFLQEDYKADYAIISEPTGLNINIGHRGSAKYKLYTYGEAKHAAIVENPYNAIENMNKLLSALFEYSAKIKKTKQHRLLGSAKSNVTMINGGTAPNIIPEECNITIERRLLPSETNKTVLKEYKKLLDVQDVKYKIENTTFLSSSLIDKNHELVNKVYYITEKYKKDTKITAFKATCEAPFFSVEKSIPTIIYGPGELSEAHTANEKVHRNQVLAAGRNFIEIGLTILEESE